MGKDGRSTEGTVYKGDLLTASNVVNQPYDGFHVKTSGQLYIQLLEDDAIKDWGTVQAGSYYPYSLKRLGEDSTCTIIGCKKRALGQGG